MEKVKLCTLTFSIAPELGHVFCDWGQDVSRQKVGFELKSLNCF